MEQELPTLPEHLFFPSIFSGVGVTRFLVLCVCLADRYLSFVLFLLAIVLSVLRFTNSDYFLGIFKRFSRFIFVKWREILKQILKKELENHLIAHVEQFLTGHFDRLCMKSSN